MRKCPEKEVEKSFINIGTECDEHVFVLIKSISKGVDHLKSAVECLLLRVVDDQGLGQLFIYVSLDVQQKCLNLLNHALKLIIIRAAKCIFDSLQLLHAYDHIFL